jgi:hypothetical protein
MECANILCVRATPRGKWIPVNTITRGGRLCATLASSRSPWAIAILKSDQPEQEAHDISGVLKAFEAKVRAELAEETTKPSDDSSLETDASPCLPSPPPSKRQRLINSDDEADEVDEEGLEKCGGGLEASRLAARRPPKEAKCVAKKGMTTIVLGGSEVKVGLHKGPGIQILAEADNIVKIFDYLKKNFQTLLAESRKSSSMRKEQMKLEPNVLDRATPLECRRNPTIANRTDTNKIRFSMKTNSYIVCYMDELGAPHTSSKGFEVARADHFGRILGVCEYKKLKSAILQKARKAWNDVDKTDKPRYEGV